MLRTHRKRNDRTGSLRLRRRLLQHRLRDDSRRDKSEHMTGRSVVRPIPDLNKKASEVPANLFDT